MSSHREAPEISKDPVADSTDVYAFVSPDQPDTVTLIANYIPLQSPAGGPNFYEFGDDVLYEIHIDNNGDGRPDITYQFRSTTVLRDPGHLPLQHRPDHVAGQPELEPPPDLLGDPRRSRRPRTARPGPGLPAVQHRPAVHAALPRAGQRTRCTTSPAAARCSPGSGPRASTSTSAPSSTSPTCGRSSSSTSSTGCTCSPARPRGSTPLHSVERALHRHSGADLAAHPRRHATRQRPGRGDRRVDNGQPPAGPALDDDARRAVCSGPYRRCHGWATRWSTRSSSRWARRTTGTRYRPSDDKRFAAYVAHRELAALLPVLYPGVFPEPGGAGQVGTARADLEAILLTGIPSGIVPGFQNYTGPVQADMLRLNTAIPPAAAQHPRPHRRRPGRLPERPPGVRRRRHHRAAGDRRGHLPAGQQDVHARRGRQAR